MRQASSAVIVVFLLGLVVGCTPSGPLELVPAHSGLCLEVIGGSPQDGTPVVQASCTDTNSQRFEFVAADAGGLTIEAEHSGKCLTVSGGSTLSGAGIVQVQCDDRLSQNFTWTSIGQLQASHSRLCLEVAAAWNEIGGSLVQSPCRDLPSQQFERIVRTTGSQGRWDPLIDLNLVPVAMANLASGEVLMWSAYQRFEFNDSPDTSTETAVFDPATKTLRNRLVTNTNHDFFCPGIANLADGQILVNGGSGAGKTSIYNPATDSWTSAPDMNISRGYNSSATLADGSVLTVGGSWSGDRAVKDSEVFRNGSWGLRPGIRGGGTLNTNDPEGQYRADNHMWLFAWTDGLVFQAGPSRTMHWLVPDSGPGGVGEVVVARTRGSDQDAMNGNAVMFDTGRILALGGASAYKLGEGTRQAHIIDISSAGANNLDAVGVRPVDSLRYSRTYSSSVVLPNGEVLVTGGQNRSEQFTDIQSVMIPELFDPITETWSSMTPMSVPRNYHSAALLLRDGRVMVGGGGLCGDCANNHPDVQIFTPPYLLDTAGNLKSRPTIEAAPTSAGYGSTIEVSVGGSATQLALVRLSNSTHSVNNAQRRLTLVNAASNGVTIRAAIPTDSGQVPPGDYWLFALDADGTPSVATAINIG